MISFDNLKSVAKVLQEAGKIEQYIQILDAQEKLLEMQARIVELETENKKLKENLSVKDALEYTNNSYWIKKNELNDGPFCSRCWDKEKLLIRIHPQLNKTYSQCPACDTSVQVSEENSSALVYRNRAEDMDW